LYSSACRLRETKAPRQRPVAGLRYGRKGFGGWSAESKIGCAVSGSRRGSEEDEVVADGVSAEDASMEAASDSGFVCVCVAGGIDTGVAAGDVDVDIDWGVLVAVLADAAMTVGVSPVFLFPSLAIFCDMVGINAPVKCVL